MGLSGVSEGLGSGVLVAVAGALGSTVDDGVAGAVEITRVMVSSEPVVTSVNWAQESSAAAQTS
ncbi:hypothetical protein [Actinomyces trachealis]|uniref:hypothetical protein n=1 Tax=Actinomyces trachealis TaxID=2763540 RepID=UPI0018C77672|nr:hypothetical protein [Actinomyces trachealis]